MNAVTRISQKGQIVVPKEVRDRLGWLPGTDLEVIEANGAVTLRVPRSGKTLSAEQAVAEFQLIYRYSGPPVSLEQMRQDAQDVVDGDRANG